MRRNLVKTLLAMTVLTSTLTMNVHAEEIKTVNGFTVEDGYSTERTGKPVILDMDFGSDVDDACALRLAGTMHLLGEIDLKAVTMSVLGEGDINLKAANGLLESQGLNGIPIGKSSVAIYDTSPYWETLANCSTTPYEVYDSVKLWRKIIAESDRPVDICTTGYLGNLAEFAKSQPDEISDRTGLDLLYNKVGNVYITGGSWTSGMDNNFWYYTEAREAFDWLLTNTEKQFIFITNEVGGPMEVGGETVRADANDPLSKALVAWGADNGRAAWDPMAMYICAIGDSEELLNQSALVTMRIDATFNKYSGANTFLENPNGKHMRVYRASEHKEYYRQILDRYCVRSNIEELKAEASKSKTEG